MASQARPAADGASPLLTREQAKQLADRVLMMSTAEQTRVNIVSEWRGNTRFADASITTSGGVTDTTLTVSVTIGKRRASSSTNVLDDASLKRTVDLAIRLARLSPEDPELMPELGPQKYAEVNAYVRATADLDPETRAAAIQRCARWRRRIHAARSSARRGSRSGSCHRTWAAEGWRGCWSG